MFNAQRSIPLSWCAAFGAAAALALCGCDQPVSKETGDAAPALATCDDGPTLFGRPEAATGLTDAQCTPGCTCAGEPFTPVEVTPQLLSMLRSRTLEDPPAVLTTDPYTEPAPDPSDEGSVCAVIPTASVDGYRLQTFSSTAAARAAGGTPTHMGACGLCSSLHDLAAYMANTDLTAPVRTCGLEYAAGPPEAHRACLEALGFTPACASIWYWNTLHTREVCLPECVAALDAPYNQADGSLNPCLQCDEDQSGAVFQAVAGRTRRNTGLPNAICRPCSEVWPLAHDYPW